MFTPRKFQAKQLASISGDLWGYLVGGREQADYYLDPDGTPSEAAAELHGRLWTRLGLAQLDRATFGRLTAGCHPVTGERLIKTSHVTKADPVTGARVSAGGFHVPGIECNLSPPKSVSALLPFVSYQERAALERAHLAAVQVTLQTCSGRNLGRCAYVDQHLGQFALSHDMIRLQVQVQDQDLRYYLLTFLQTPTGQARLEDLLGRAGDGAQG